VLLVTSNGNPISNKTSNLCINCYITRSKTRQRDGVDIQDKHNEEEEEKEEEKTLFNDTVLSSDGEIFHQFTCNRINLGELNFSPLFSRLGVGEGGLLKQF
jgi:hypothetical protein